MKKCMYFILCLAITWACTTTEKKETVLCLRTTTESDVAEYALALDSAQRYIRRYDSIAFRVFYQPNPIRAFTIRAEDLLQALGVSLQDTTQVKFKHVRLYLGVDRKNRFRAFITPVVGANIRKKQAGRDTIMSGPFQQNWMLDLPATTESGQYVFDFTMPCPNSCDEQSKLFGQKEGSIAKN